MVQGEIMGLSLPVMAAFVALVLGLGLVAHQLHRMVKPRVVRRSVDYRVAARRIRHRRG